VTRSLVRWGVAGWLGYLLWIPAKAITAAADPARAVEAEQLRALFAPVGPLAFLGPLGFQQWLYPLPVWNTFGMQLALHNVPLAFVLAGYLGGIAVLVRAMSASPQGAPAAAQPARRAILGFAALYLLAALLIYPPTRDAWYYLANAHAWTVYGVNPYLVPAPEVPDPSRIAALNADDYINHLPYTYGPAWLLATGALVRGLGDRPLLVLLVLKLGLAACAALGLWAVDRGLAVLAPDQRELGLLLYAWSPMLLFTGIAGAHNDVALAGLAMLGMWWTVQGAAPRGLPVLTLGFLVKYASWPQALAALAGCPLTRAALPRLAAGVVLSALLVAACFTPFWSGPATFGGLQQQLSMWGITPLDVFAHALVPAFRGGWTEAQLPAAVAGWLAFLAVGAAAAWRLRTHPPLMRAALLALQLTLLFFYLANRRFLVWYGVWIVPPLALCAFAPRWWRAGVAFTLGVLLAANVFLLTDLTGIDLRLLALPLIYLPPVWMLFSAPAKKAPDPTTSLPAV
jgi:hypothetical protein